MKAEYTNGYADMYEDEEDNGSFIPKPQQNGNESLLNQHLNASNILNSLKKMLMGYEFDDEDGEWKKSKIQIVGEDNKLYEMDEPPLMEPRDIRITIGYLQMFLNSNTYLSQIKEERVNDIMWDINVKLASLFYKLRHKIGPEIRDLIWGMIEYPILMGVNRATNKITLDAMSKMQHSVEHINPNGMNEKKPEKEFKLFGF